MSRRDGGRHIMSFLHPKSIKVILRRFKYLTGGKARSATIPGHPESVDPPEICPPASHIGRLPDELLIMVLDCVHAAYFRERYVSSFYEWLSILRVCRRWRNITLSVSRLWRVVPISSDLTPLQWCLALHGDTPLEIRMHNPWLSSVSLDLFGSHISSIRVLALHVAHMDIRYSPFDAILSISMPGLEELKIFPDFLLDDRLPPRSVVNMEQYPRLRRLDLRGIIVPPNISTLCEIELDRCSWLFSFHDFIQTLGSCSQLVELHLKQSLRSLASTAPREIPANPRRATLPSLRKLNIADNSACIIAGVMGHLDIPAIASLRILCCRLRPARDEEAQFSESEHLFRTLIPGDPSRILPTFPTDACPVSASLTFMEDLCIVRVESTALPTPISVNLQARFDLDWTRVVPAALQDISHLFSKTPVTELVVQGSSYHILPSVWEELFTSLPLLQRLELTGNGTWTAMWQGLHRASAWSAQSCCPQLTRVHIRHTSRPQDNYPAPPDERDLEIIASALRERAEAGAKLDELLWAVYSLHHPNYYASRGRFMARLAPYVERVTYEDLEQGVQNRSYVYPQITIFH
ncbi:hypothetical protein TRAPUB_5318 [Trametes pubescens]|uniref:F-box domain-containing protein n=1 Tax=Trametes pubescens TaxID=154538 RepID=A0A1M2V8U6_TRAPU|nr:hypothetical protein TRAPUB_5318 [Trametes pubescens]